MRYSKDFRQKVMSLKASKKLTVRATAERFGLSATTVHAWVKRIEARPCGPVKGRRCKLDLSELEAYYQNNNSAYQAEAAAHFGVARSTIWRGLQSLKWTHQKNVGTPKG